MQREFIDVLLPWVSRIVHNASSKMGAKGANQSGSKLLSLDQLSNLFECLLALLKEADPLCGPESDELGASVGGDLDGSVSSYGGRVLEKQQRAEVLRIY